MITKKEFDSYLHGKNIIIVGNSQSVLEKIDGKFKIPKGFVDSHDVVVRFNGGHPGLLRNIIGRRTDIWSTNRYNKDAYIYYPEAKYVFFPFYILEVEPSVKHKTYQPGLDFYCDIFKIFNPNLDIDENHFPYDIVEWNKKEGIKPTSGSMVLKYMVDNIKYANITLVGFDFLQSKNFFRKKNMRRIGHSSEVEEKFITDISKANSNIKIQ